MEGDGVTISKTERELTCETTAVSMSDNIFDPSLSTSVPSGGSATLLHGGNDSQLSSLSDNQERIISVLYVISGSLSVLGSSMIVYLVLRNSRKTPYKRIILGMSICDIFASITWILSPFLVPANHHSSRVWAIGTETTCNVLGFFTMLTCATIWYNGVLSCYYLLTVRFRVKPAVFARRFEPWVHFLCIGYNVGAATLGYVRSYFSEIEFGLGCFIGDYNATCAVTGECRTSIVGWISAGVPIVLTFVSILVNNTIVYCYVRTITQCRTISKGERNNKQHQRMQAVVSQAWLYVGTFLLSYSPAFVAQVLESVNFRPNQMSQIYPLFVLQAIFLPMQGVFNLLVYSRPNYMRVRKEFPNESRLFALHRVWFVTAPSRFTTVDATLWTSPNVNTSSLGFQVIPNIEQARLLASQQFSATFSGKHALRRDIRLRDQWESHSAAAISFESTGNGLMSSSHSTSGHRTETQPIVTSKRSKRENQELRQIEKQGTHEAQLQHTGLLGLSNIEHTNLVMIDDPTRSGGSGDQDESVAPNGGLELDDGSALPQEAFSPVDSSFLMNDDPDEFQFGDFMSGESDE